MFFLQNQTVLHRNNIALSVSASCIFPPPHNNKNMFVPCAASAEMFGFLRPSVSVCPLFPQDHADSAELRRPAASELPGRPELLSEPKRPECVQPVGEVRPVRL